MRSLPLGTFVTHQRFSLKTLEMTSDARRFLKSTAPVRSEEACTRELQINHFTCDIDTSESNNVRDDGDNNDNDQHNKRH